MARTVEPPRHPVALLEPHPVIRAALADWLEAHGPYRVGWCGAEADALFAALEQGPGAGEARPALVLVGLRPPAEEGLQVLERLGTAPAGPYAVALAHEPDEGTILRAYRAGARALFCCRFHTRAVLEALPAVLQGVVVHSPESQRLLLENPDGLSPAERRRQRLLRQITGRRLEVLEALVQEPDQTSRSLGERWRISARTVESHIRALLGTFGVRSRTALVVAAIRVGVVRV